MGWQDKTIFVTGATGFIGGRVCERLVQEKASRVRALVHTVQRAPRIARLPIELCVGDLLDRNSLRRAFADSQIVVHCASGIGRGIVRSTRNLLQAAQAAGVERFVHISTAAVYGLTPPPGSEIEQAPLRRTGEEYCDNKIRAERVVARFLRRGVPAVILRPSIVYGPYSAWSTRLIEALRHDLVALIDGGSGACNTTYVDNLVDAILLALENRHSVGETFFITDGERVTWGDFIRAHADMIVPNRKLAEISKREVLARYHKQPGVWRSSLREARTLLFSRELRLLILKIPLCKQLLAPVWRELESMPPERRRWVRELLRNGSTAPQVSGETFLPDPVDFATQTGTVFFDIGKARRTLGYEPRVCFSQGMKLVEHWLHFANYLSDTSPISDSSLGD